MKLYYYKNQGASINFGDNLNQWLWPKLLGDFLDQDDSELFVGFGTMLNERLPKSNTLNIFSTGYGYNTQTTKPEKNWIIHCVRGPLTASALGIDKKYVISDGAILTSRFLQRSQVPKYKYAYMPHFVNSNLRWKGASEEIGIKFIDPTQPVSITLKEVSQTEILFTEAMHGAIIADSLSIPWVPVVSSRIINTFKWNDYCQSMRISYEPKRLPPMSGVVNDTVSGRLRAYCKYKWVKNEFKNLIKWATPINTENSLMASRIQQLEDCLEWLTRSKG